MNAIWDLWAKTLNKPVWRIVADMSPKEVVELIDFRYITDALTPEEALEILTKSEEGKKERLQEALDSRAVPAYTTSAGWLGYGQEKMRGLLRETLAKGYRHFKLKVGGNLEQDKERLSIAREIIGFDKGNVLMVDANQVWSVPEAIEYMKELKDFKPWFIEEPTSPDDGMYLPRLVSTLDLLTQFCSSWPQSYSRSSQALQYRRRHRRNVPKSRHVQAVPRIRRNRCMPNRCVSSRRRKRSDRSPSDGRKIRRSHRTSQRRRWSSRVHTASLNHRLRCCVWKEERARVR